MNKKNYFIDFLIYHLTKLKRKIVIRITQLILIAYKRKLPNELISVMKKNRKFLRTVNEFLPEAEYDDEHNNYGIQNYIYTNLKKEINLFPTYTDILILLIPELKSKMVNYLEIGTSVFKNFQQVENSIEGSVLYGYDMNDLILSIKEKYKLKSKVDKVSKQEYFYSNDRNQIYYFKNNVLSKEGGQIFQNLLSAKINVIFSDALHSEQGIVSEYENIIKGHLADDFIYYFDDLNMYDVEDGVLRVYKDIKSKNNKVNFYSFWAYGWIGQYEKLHKIGLITTLDIASIFKKKEISMPLFKEITNA